MPAGRSPNMLPARSRIAPGRPRRSCRRGCRSTRHVLVGSAQPVNLGLAEELVQVDLAILIGELALEYGEILRIDPSWFLSNRLMRRNLTLGGMSSESSEPSAARVEAADGLESMDEAALCAARAARSQRFPDRRSPFRTAPRATPPPTKALTWSNSPLCGAGNFTSVLQAGRRLVKLQTTGGSWADHAQAFALLVVFVLIGFPCASYSCGLVSVPVPVPPTG